MYSSRDSERRGDKKSDHASLPIRTIAKRDFWPSYLDKYREMFFAVRNREMEKLSRDELKGSWKAWGLFETYLTKLWRKRHE